jgi:hypothetical protein
LELDQERDVKVIMSLDIEKLLEFIEKYSIEKHAWIVNSLYRGKFCITFDPIKDPRWSFRSIEDKGYTATELSKLTQLIDLEKINLNELESIIATDLCTQALYSHLFIEKVKQLIGKETVDNIMSIITDVTTPSTNQSNSKLTIVKNK